MMRNPATETEDGPILDRIRAEAMPLEKTGDIEELLSSIGDSRITMLGEASHGTSEFYSWRTEITKRLIRDHGVRIIAVEGDWPSCYEINRWIKDDTRQAEGAEELLKRAFHRWPAWMWANREIVELIEWLRAWNRSRLPEDRAGFYGLDVYSLWESIDEVLAYLRKKGDVPALEAAKQAFDCFHAYNRDEQRYAVSAAYVDASCEDEVVELLKRLRQERLRQEDGGGGADAAFNAEINALIAVNAEHYYRIMIGGDAESWNARDRHMTEVLDKLLEHYGEGAKAVIWEHNTHIGDARATDMAAEQMVNVGQLVRERHRKSYAVGFSTYKGTVMAGMSWGSPGETMPVPEARHNSWDELLHRAGGGNKLLLLRGISTREYEKIRGQRAIGVVYRPGNERGNYVPTALSKRYDALLYLEETTALHPVL